MADRLAGLLRHYSLSARVFHSGAFCEQHHYAAPHGYIHRGAARPDYGAFARA